MLEVLAPTLSEVRSFLEQGGPAILAIAALSVVTMALILWKAWRLTVLGAWAGGNARRAIELWGDGKKAEAKMAVAKAGGLRARVIRAALVACSDPYLSEDHAREETVRVARVELTRARAGLRALELIATIAPLIGLMGTVLGMIAAFQALQEAGARADPATLAGGIWEALLTTAAGMAVAIPASIALTWFESITDRLQLEMEDGATRIFTAKMPPQDPLFQAAE